MLEIPADLAAEVDLVAAVSYDASGNPIALSGITALDGATHLDIAIASGDPALAVDVIGWQGADIPGFALAAPEQARTTPLAIAARCDAALPPARVARRIHGDGEPQGTTLQLASTAVRGTPCLPGWSDDISVEFRCLTSFCEPLVREDGCTALVDLQNCGQGRFEVRTRVGAPCVTSAENQCGTERALASRATELGCNLAGVACEIRFFTAKDASWATVTRAQVLDVPYLEVPDNSGVTARTWYPYLGYTGSIFPLAERIGVVSYGGRYRGHGNCTSLIDDEITWLDRDLRFSATSTLPPCTTRVLPTADGQRAFGVAAVLDDRDVDTQAVASLTFFAIDATGKITRRTPLDLAGLDLCNVNEAVLTPDEQSIVIGTCRTPSHDPGQLLVVDVATLAVRTIGIEDNNIYGLAFEGETLMALGDEEDAITWVDVRTGVTRATGIVPTAVSLSNGQAIADLATDRTFVATPSDEATIGIFTRRRFDTRTSVFEGDWQPISFARIGPGQSQIVVASARPPRGRQQWTAGLSRISLEDLGVLPGLLELGPGVMGPSFTAPDGTLYATLPWTGEILKIRLISSR